MKTSLLVAVAVTVGLGASSVPALMPSAHAEGTVQESKQAPKGTGTSLTEATGKLKTDAMKTKDDAKALDLEKTKLGAGQVKEDVTGVKESAKGMLTNPLGK
jgi:hypothetical protein